MKKLLVCLLLFALILPLAACPSSGPNPGPNPTPGPGGDSEWADSVGELYCEGDSITVSCFAPYSYEIYGSEDGNWIENEVYKRNLALETRFNAKIENDTIASTGVTDQESHYNNVSRAFTNSNVEFDLLAMYAWQCGKLITQGYFCDWRAEIPYCSDSIKAKNEWWPEKVNLDCTINGYQFVAISDLCLTAMEMCDVIVFNQELTENYNIPSKIKSTSTNQPYDTMYNVVRGGDWTLDNFYAVTKDFYIPSVSNTSGTAELGDTFGLNIASYDSFAYSTGLHFIENDGINEPTLWTVNARVITSIEKMTQICNAEGSVGSHNIRVGTSSNDTLPFFAEGHCVFATMALEDLKSDIMHQMENRAVNPFGVLPYPKYDLSQKEYLTGSRDHYTLLAVPTEFLDADAAHQKTVGALIEAMSAYTCRNIKNEYYKVIITHNNTHDAESVEMIDIVMKGRVYDISVFHYIDLYTESTGLPTNSSLGLFYRHMLSNKRGYNVSEVWEGVRDRVEAEFEELIEKYNTLTGN